MISAAMSRDSQRLQGKRAADRRARCSGSRGRVPPPGSGYMNTKNPNAGPDQRNNGQPPTIKKMANKQGNSETISIYG